MVVFPAIKHSHWSFFQGRVACFGALSHINVIACTPASSICNINVFGCFSKFPNNMLLLACKIFLKSNGVVTWKSNYNVITSFFKSITILIIKSNQLTVVDYLVIDCSPTLLIWQLKVGCGCEHECGGSFSPCAISLFYPDLWPATAQTGWCRIDGGRDQRGWTLDLRWRTWGDHTDFSSRSRWEVHRRATQTHRDSDFCLKLKGKKKQKSPLRGLCHSGRMI